MKVVYIRIHFYLYSYYLFYIKIYNIIEILFRLYIYIEKGLTINITSERITNFHINILFILKHIPKGKFSVYYM